MSHIYAIMMLCFSFVLLISVHLCIVKSKLNIANINHLMKLDGDQDEIYCHNNNNYIMVYL